MQLHDEYEVNDCDKGWMQESGYEDDVLFLTKVLNSSL